MKRKIVSFVIVLLFCVAFLLPVPAFAGEPTDQVRTRVDAVLEILKDPGLKGPEHEKARHDKIRAIVDTIFDFNEMSRRSLGMHWKGKTPGERQEFISLFSDLLQDTYIRKVEQNYKDQKVLYTGESVLGLNAEVKTKVISRSEIETPINYRLLKKDNKWVVYDVVIEGVSLVNNYRSQFSEILSSGSWQTLIQKLKNRTLKEPVK